MSSLNKVVARGKGHRDEFVADAALTPGHLLEINSDNEVLVHATRGGWAERMFAEEDALQGKTIDQAYAADDQVFCYHAVPGDRIQAILLDGEVAIIGSRLISNGDGTLILAGDGNAGDDVLYQNIAASAEIENVTAETVFDKSFTIPADYLQVGDVIQIDARCLVVDDNSTDTLNLKLKIGSTVIYATGTVDVATNDVGHITATLVIRTIGGSGTIVGGGLGALGVPGTVTAKPFDLTSTAIDTTATQLISVTGTWSVAHADNEVRLDNLTITLLRGTKDIIAISAEALSPSGSDGQHLVRIVA